MYGVTHFLLHKSNGHHSENFLVLNDNKSIHPEITISSSKTSNVSHNSATEKYFIILNEKSLPQSVLS